MNDQNAPEDTRKERQEKRRRILWYSVARDDQQDPVPEPARTETEQMIDVLNRIAEQTAPPTPKKKQKLPHSTQDVHEWWAKLPAKTKFLFRHGSALGLGAWGYGLLEGDFSIGLPQTFGAWMRAAAASSTSPYTGLALGAFIVLGTAFIGARVMTTVGKWLAFSPVLLGTVRYALAVPMSSAVFAVLIHTTAATV
ncbi:hypothetical protein EF910_32125 [Streptomyces sp. WAC07149]|uniref:hypothetical protein n=1 Tax=Streptomyces sp. WAC07149 TaxID=2487425 RepID=UPI000F79046E|nr:hypothetical protein [Streptomyces sp. WAC07149]RST00384.1 hypothetical protein EF910_32125 [Streptomyces sp. WAC07149]